VRRVSVVGGSGSGKTTLARALAEALDADFIELDALVHQADWQPTPRDELRALLAPMLDAERWVVDGNYAEQVRDLVWDAADTIIWLDLPRLVATGAVARRSIGRVLRREELWNGNRERFYHLFDPRPDRNVTLWAFVKHPEYRRMYEAALAEPTIASKQVVRVRSWTEAGEFLEALRRQT
jgi:adenylate kinase family enzyme